jgi:ketosteroid isomerase-like protein
MDEKASYRRVAVGVLCVLLCACATSGASDAGRVDQEARKAHQAWWQAYAEGDVATVADHTADDVEVVFSSGSRLRRAAVIEQAGKHSRSSGFVMAWSEESVRYPGPGIAVVSGTSTERAGSSEQVFRITTVLERAGQPDWKVAHAQSTRVARFAPAVPYSVAGIVEDYVGAYSTPKGRVLKMEARDGSLWMVEPDGKAFGLTPIGPGLFESTGSSPLNGVLRFSFARDASGRVVSFSRLTEGHVDTFPRANQ